MRRNDLFNVTESGEELKLKSLVISLVPVMQHDNGVKQTF